MAVRKIKENIFAVGVIHWDRKVFDELIPLPDGTSYNSYLVFGSEKTALIDTVDPALSGEFLANISEFKGLKIDYLVSQHAEQDHSGSIPLILERFPECKIVTNEKCKGLLMEHLHIAEEKFIVIGDGEILSLGNKTLKFIFTPWVHWPETMSALLEEDKILFTCDFFGSHYATSDLFAKNKEHIAEGAKRYYAEIMMPFRNFISSNLKKLEGYDFSIIAPSHGPLYDEPNFIIDLYKEWISDKPKNEVLLLYISMHGSTKIIAERLFNDLVEKGIKVVPYNLATADIGEIAMSAVDAATIVFAMPTVLAGPHPAGAYATIFINAIKPKVKFIALVTSYGWGGQTIPWIKNHLTNFKGEFLEPLEIKGLPDEEAFKRIDKLATDISEKHKLLGLFE
ncbi:MAG: FprA family A-type flavoprotein [Caldisericaceae bacterium]